MEKLIPVLESYVLFADRATAEMNKAWKQLIPYVILVKDDEVYVTERLSDSEQRLKGLLSVGLGGHIEATDASDSITGCVNRGMHRELREEAEINSHGKPPMPIGIVYDDLTDVGQVHLGIVFIKELSPNDKVKVKETDKLKGYFEKPGNLDLGRTEGWATPIIQFLIEQDTHAEEEVQTNM